MGWALVVSDGTSVSSYRLCTKPLDIRYDFAAVLNLIFDYPLLGEGVPLWGGHWWCQTGRQ